MEMKRGGHPIDLRLIGTVGGFPYEDSIGFDNFEELAGVGSARDL
jgi:hypothetical protein